MVTMAIVFAMIIIIRIFFVQFTIRTYSDLYASELNIADTKKGKGPETQDTLNLLYQIMQDSNVIRRSLISNKIVILDGVLISDPYGLIKEKFRIPYLPYLYEYQGLYYLFIGVPIFETSFLIIGNPSLEITALLKSFNKITTFILISGFFLSYCFIFFGKKYS